MKNSIKVLSLGLVALGFPVLVARAGYFTYPPGGQDGCGQGGGGGGSPGGNSGPTAVPGIAQPRDALAAGGGAPGDISCGTCGGFGSGDGASATGGGGCPCGAGGGGPPFGPGGGGPGSGWGPTWVGGGNWDGPGSLGMPIWEVSEPYINLWLYDNPLSYQPGIGPRVSFQAAYKQRDVPAVSPGIFSLGNNWNCSWLSYIEDDPANSQGLLNAKSGGIVGFTNLSGTNVEYFTHSTLLRYTNTDGTLAFTRNYANGVIDYYSATPAHGVVLPDGNLPVFLSSRLDPFGRVVLAFSYQTVPSGPGWVFQLVSVTDGDGRATTLSYTNSDPSLITVATDPFGRSAVLTYNTNGMLTNITDVAGLSSSFVYDTNGWVTSLTTPYGTTSFYYLDTPLPWDPGRYYYVVRAATIVDAAGGTNIYGLWEQPASGVGSLWYLPDWSSVLSAALPNATFDDDPTAFRYRNSFHWGPRQAPSLPSNLNSFDTNQFILARMHHWLHATTNCSVQADALLSQTLSLEVAPSPDGVTPGQMTFYDQGGKTCNYHEGTNSLPSAIARVLPDGTVSYSTYQRDVWGRPTTSTETYSAGYGAAPSTRSWQYSYSADGIDLVKVLGPRGETLAGYSYTNHLPLTATNAVGDVTSWTLDARGRVTSVKSPAGLTTTNIYFTTGTLTNFIQTMIDLEIGRNNSFIYTNDLVAVHTDERGLSTTNRFDALDRLTASITSLGTISYTYNKLDLASTVDRMGFTTSSGFDALRRLVAQTNALGFFTLYNYCACGALDSIQDAAGNFTLFYYDNAGRRTATVYPDSYSVTNQLSLLGQVTNVLDSAGYSLKSWFDNQGLLYAVTNAYGQTITISFDIEDRATTNVDANGVSIASTFDNLGRVLSRSYPDGGVETFSWSARGLVAYTNQIGSGTEHAYDAAGRKTSEINANDQLLSFTNDAAGDLVALTDGNGHTTRWTYDAYGRATNKLDQVGTVILKYNYDADSRLTNRWSAAKGNTYYAYDSVGNLTNIAYPSSGTVQFQYDPLNRLTSMVDAVGTTTYSYTKGSQLYTEAGPWASDTVTNTYVNRRRVSMTLQQPTGSWTNGFIYDAAGRLTNVTSQAGSFAYLFASGLQNLPAEILLPNTSYVTNTYDAVARVTGTYLKNTGHTTLDAATYSYNLAGQRTAMGRTDASTVSYTYDPIGQLKTALGNGGQSTEHLGYTYDTAWNLSWLTNSGSTSQFTVDNDNQLTNAAGNACTYDANGNLTEQNLGVAHDLLYTYDDENRLIEVFDDFSGWETVFKYDGLGRLRTRLELQSSGGSPPPPSSPPPGGTNYLYDGWRVIQERETNNAPETSYTSGLDLSGTPQGAGGIGGLLARSGGYSSGNWTNHNYYHADGNGNITYLENSSQGLAASYLYDPFGNTTQTNGPIGAANLYRFSSKECHLNSGMYYYGYRFYDPGFQRWINRDPIMERGGLNLYAFVRNDPADRRDPRGFSDDNRPPIKLTPIGGGLDPTYPRWPAREPGRHRGSCPDPPCPGGQPRRPRWQNLDYPSYPACVGDQSFSPGTQIGLTAIGIVVGIRGGVPGAIIGTGIGGVLLGDEAFAAFYCSEVVCPDDF